MRLLNLRINFFYLLRTFCPHLGSFCVVSSSQGFGQISPLMEDQIKRTNNWIYKTKKSWSPSGPVAQRIEALSLYCFRWAFSEGSGFKPYPSRPEVYFLKKRGAIDNNYGRQELLGIRLQDSAFLSEAAVNHLKKARGEIWPKLCEEETTQKLPRWGQKVRYK